ncbi:superoxide dismutase [Clostridia bacterium]|nr:superoxide dismutase [Clostridia bacterium]
MNYPYKLPPLPYPYDALEPYIDEETMHYHHDKHFQTYIDNLNAALAPYPALQDIPLETLLSNPEKLPDAAREAILHNGGGVYNHNAFFNGLSPAGADNHTPTGDLAKTIDAAYGSFENFKKTFNEQAASVFGSGWTMLGLTENGTPAIVKLANQSTASMLNMKPAVLVDVWEHAYYLKYKNLRAEYLQGVWNVLRF